MATAWQAMSTHGDEAGISIIHERSIRPEEERVIADRAHFLRFFSNIYSFSFAMATYIVSYLDIEDRLDNSIKILDRVRSVEDLVKYHQGKVYEDPLYDKFR